MAVAGGVRTDNADKWLFDRCREVQAEPDNRLDLWAREHYKSTIITFALTIFEILNDPEVTIGIFSHTRPIAKGFLRQIKQELKLNEFLKGLFPEIFWNDPEGQAPKWSEDDGLVVKRKDNPKESTVEAWGVVEGQPTSKHFKILLYDDVVTEKSVTSPDMMEKTIDALALSYNLGVLGGKRRFVGTRYHFNDAYKSLLERGTATTRYHPATDDGTVSGSPVLLAPEELAKKRADMGPYIYACQMLQNPKADETQGFVEAWIRRHEGNLTLSTLNKYILVDPANEKKKSNDYTCMWCVGLGADQNYYIIDVVRDRLGLTERTDKLFEWHRKYQPKAVAYEQYGMQADIQHIKDRQARDNYRFDITKVGGGTPKPDRIKTLMPLFEQGRIYFPPSVFYTNYEGTTEDLVQVFMEQEYKAFPVAVHDDMLDALARINDPRLQLVWPKPRSPQGPHRRNRRRAPASDTSYMAA